MWYKIQTQFVIVSIFAKPNAKKSAVISIVDNDLQVAVSAKPDSGAANKVLIAFLAKYFQVPKSSIQLLKGHKSRHKKIQMPLSEDLILKLQSLNESLK